ncbi:MBL fold metallo-hydrolase [Pseudomonas rhodesiae]|uniref:MBL fold metallo-hydrolase n=1 Tax=Pseudomonas rhodesiae TaxID=76760 RepID=UPI0021609A9D|nr:MBL fold metallo-hydrolase [Pseudomonas rhodesiae]UVL11441.1 MBL fold metallo-hydrolase [Pseudomonas rhodesiae]
MFSIQMLPAREGDAIWIRWGEEHTPYQMLIDMGTEEIGKTLSQKISALPQAQRTFEAIVVTHIDADHIGGFLSCFVDSDKPSGVSVKDFWFNGYMHLDGRRSSSTLEALGAVQAERLTNWLITQPWNTLFNGGAICRREGEPLEVIELAGGMKVTVLGPTVQRLKELKPEWDKEIKIATQKKEQARSVSVLEPMGASLSLELPSAQSLKNLAKQKPLRDTKAANGSSIVLLLEYEDKKILLAGDSFAEDLVEAVTQLSPERPLQLAAFKVPHHCSRGNISERLIATINCPNWLISTDGSRHKHPDDEGIASILHYGENTSVRLLFNVSSKYNSKWSRTEWQSRFSYSTDYGSDEDGHSLDI